VATKIDSRRKEFPPLNGNVQRLFCLAGWRSSKGVATWRWSVHENRDHPTTACHRQVQAADNLSQTTGSG
jgi:hypothetical protein